MGGTGTRAGSSQDGSSMTPAISVVVYDPSGKTTGQTFPPGSVWVKPQLKRITRRSLLYKQEQMAKRAKKTV
jgi:hypothetical protein